MDAILAKYSASISELKKNPSALIQKAQGSAITILNRNKPAAYLIPATMYEEMLEKIEDHELGEIVAARKTQKDKAIEVSINDL